jgi:UDP-N-acetylmuramate dehydrogenase
MPGIVEPPVRDEAALATAIDLLGLRADGGLAERDVPLGPLTTYRVGGPAALFVRARRGDLPRVAAAARAARLPVLVVGRGSNMLVADTGFPGIAVTVLGGEDAVDIDPTNGTVRAGAGVALPVLARKTAAAGLHGFEWAVGVPGSIGGAVRMNAGGHGSDMAACLVDVVVVDLALDGARRGGGTIASPVDEPPAEEQVVPVGALELGFRSSGLAHDAVVVEARLQLSPGDPTAAKQLIDEIVAWRRANQPGGQNAGSVFVNPVPGEVTCGALIDAAGLRGLRIGSAAVSDKHANFIQADEGGRAADVRAVMRAVAERVEQHSGYRLRTEVRLVGFDEVAD